MTTYRTLAEVQDEVVEVAVELVWINKRLNDLAQSVPLPRDVDQMRKNRVPETAAAYLHGMIDVVRQDLLEDAIVTLLAGANRRDADLREEFTHPRSIRDLGPTTEEQHEDEA
jgi:hypothetical protein